MYILGISAYYHDSAAALIKDGEIVAAAQEERFSRVKGDSSFPLQAAAFCLKQANIQIRQVDRIVFYEDSRKKFNRLFSNFLFFSPQGVKAFTEAMCAFLGGKLDIPSQISRRLNYEGRIDWIDHHLSHAASAFYPSPFERAAILTMDGVGEWATTIIGTGEGNTIQLLEEMRFPHSLGMLYSAFTYYAGFKVNSGEYKLMGLAPYGEPRYAQLILDHLIDLKEDGSFQMNMRYFDYGTGFKMINSHFEELFKGPARLPESPITQKEMDLAKSIQVVLEEIILRLVRKTKKITSQRHLCLAGGVALNCVANGKILREKIFDKMWIQPAAGDAGGALGCALYVWYTQGNHERKVVGSEDFQKGSYLGPSYSNEEIRGFLEREECSFECFSDKESLAHSAARLMAQEKIIGLFHGRMEYGPRALGNRSIIGDPRSPQMQSLMNLKIKFRESFRPFAPSVLEERASDFFDFPANEQSPYMLFVVDVCQGKRKKLTPEEETLWGIDQLKVLRSEIPAVTHVDYSARLQTVSRQSNPFFYAIIKNFESLTGCPVVINTSFNVRGEPIVCSYQDAYRCFMRTNIDYLVLENFLLDKTKQKSLRKDVNWQKQFALD